jgi:ornithine--oxo-acid transaminase
LTERSAELGAYFLAELQAIKSPAIRKIRGIGLWVGIEIESTIATARQICEKLKERGVLSKETRHTVVRLAPPLVITKEELDWGIEQIKAVLTLE